MCKDLLPGELHEVMSERIEFEKALMKDIKAFVEIIRKETVSCPPYAPHKVSDSGKASFSLRNESEKPNISKKRKPQLPVFLFPHHAERGMRHLLHNCKAFPEDQKNGLIARFRANKIEEKTEEAKRATEQDSNPSPQNHVTLFETFGGHLQ